MNPTAPKLTFVFEIQAEVASPTDLGITQVGHRRIIQILGGRFEGPNLRGEVLAGGADWQILRPDGSAELDARYTLRTESGALIYVNNQGMRTGSPEVLRALNAGEKVDPSLIYFASTPRFETSDPELAWLTRRIFTAVAERQPRNVVIRVFQVG